jgi:hypothetical protein
MIRPPSNQRVYTAVFSRDPVFVQLPDEPSDEQLAELRQKWTNARETGDYTALLVEPSGEPTLFDMKQLTTDQYVAIMDVYRSSPQEAAVLAFRTALTDIRNFIKVDIKRVNHKKLGMIATTEFFDKANVPPGLAHQIVVELGSLVISKAHGISPK